MFLELPHRISLPLFFKNYMLGLFEDNTATPWYMRAINQSKTSLLFVKSMHARFTNDYYDFMKDVEYAENGVKLPGLIRCRNEAEHFGMASSVMKSTITSETSVNKPELLQVVVTHVIVDKKSRQSTSYKDVLRLEDGKFPLLANVPTYDFGVIPPNLKPQKEHRVTTTDLDIYNHTNVNVYLGLYLDAVEERLLHKRPKGSAISSLVVREIVMSFHHESRLGDELHVYTWENVDCSGTVYGKVTNGTVLLVLCKLMYDTTLVKTTNMARL